MNLLESDGEFPSRLDVLEFVDECLHILMFLITTRRERYWSVSLKGRSGVYQTIAKEELDIPDCKAEIYSLEVLKWEDGLLKQYPILSYPDNCLKIVNF